jgi:hypothetical protein
MIGRRKTLAAFLFLLTVLFVATVLGMRSRIQEPQNMSKRQQKHRALPVVNFDAPASTDKQLRAKREARSKRYDKYSGTPIQEAPHISGGILSSHWADDLPAIPITESDLIVVGVVSSAEAHLSNDRTGIYSEFTVRVQEVLKNEKDSILPITAITVERYGGAVRFRSGSIQTYETAGQGMPLFGSKYLFFLKHTTEDQFLILTGYEVGESSVSPLDGSAVEDGTRDWVFDQYKGHDASLFIEKVRNRINRN